MAHKDRIFELRAEGKTYDEIKELIGASKGTISYHLGEGQREKTNERTNATRAIIRKWLKDQKEDNPCTDCGRYYRYYQMQFDHLPEFEKHFSLSDYKTHTKDIEVVKAEVAKCELVCANCHFERTHLRMRAGDDWVDDIFESELG